MNIARELIRPTPQGGRKGGLPEHVQAITLDDVQRALEAILQAQERDPRPGRCRGRGRGAPSGDGPFRQARARRGGSQTGRARFAEAGAVRELAVKSLQPQAEPVACLAYAAPEPGSELYAPFLVLVARFWAASAQPGGGGGTGRPSVYFPLLEDPAVLGVSTHGESG